MNRGILYILTGHKHNANLIVSLYALRKFWRGEVQIACGDDDAYEFGLNLDRDDRLAPLTITRFDMRPGRNATYSIKPRMYEFSRFNETIFVDADTLVVKGIDELWPAIRDVRLTSFCGWVSTGNKMSGRIKKWEHVEPELVADQLATPHPALNTGVVVWRDSEASAAFFTDWYATTCKHISFICDEIAAQLIYPRHECVSIVDDQWNASVIYAKDRDSVRIWHGHGGKFWKKDSGRSIFIPFARACVEQDIGGAASNEKLTNLLREYGDAENLVV